MTPDYEMSAQQEVADVSFGRPHVVVLGAGATRAACPNGDRRGRQVPVMADFAKILGLESLLKSWGFDPQENFEEIYSDLTEAGDQTKTALLQNHIEIYMQSLQLPEIPTVYDHLVLSLRENDLLATFNWDPLLLQAYRRNRRLGLKLPRLAFLHGCVSVGYCGKHKVAGLSGNRCSRCGEVLTRSPLLYPIRKKDYAFDQFIANEWQTLRSRIENAFMITIFGYSGPKSDQEAITTMREAWQKKERSLEQSAFITLQSDAEITANWKEFIYSHHYEIHSSFDDSWIANHPRRTGEAYWNQFMEVRFLEGNPIPKAAKLDDLWSWYEQFKEAEDQYEQQAGLTRTEASVRAMGLK